MKRVNRLLLRNVAAVIAPSQAVQLAIARDGIFELNKVAVIYNGVDPARYEGESRRKDEMITVGTVGHLSKIKGQDTFIAAAALLRSHYPDLNVRFTIVGDDRAKDQRNRKDLVALISECGLEDTVELAGWTDDIREKLAEMDIFVSAARSEPFGLAIVEAMMSGVPVIAARCEGPLEIIEDGVSGLLVPIDDPEQIAEKIVSLIRDPDLRSSLKRAGCEAAVARFSLSRMVHETEDLYRAVIRTGDLD
jgi:glycosyltransferase involved in cell wall biosynthesis